jgi:hypothetical protein
METSSLYDQAYEALDRAMGTHGAVRHGLMEEAVRLHRSAVERRDLLSERSPTEPPKSR